MKDLLKPQRKIRRREGRKRGSGFGGRVGSDSSLLFHSIKLFIYLPPPTYRIPVPTPSAKTLVQFAPLDFGWPRMRGAACNHRQKRH